MRDKIRSGLIRFVNAKYSLPSWLWAIASTIVGAAIVAYAIFNPAVLTEFVKYLVLDGWIWGPVLTLGGLIAMIGMAKDWARWVRVGAFSSFCMWIFGSIAFFFTGGIVNVLIFAGPMLVFWAYKYLASYVREFPRL
jgi:hypothetical protein